MKTELVGKKFNRLTVVEFITILKSGHSKYRCLCDCGKECIVQGGNLINNHTQSCGCLQLSIAGKSQMLSNGQAGFNRLFLNYKNGAKNRNIAFELTKELFLELTKMNCRYCDLSPSSIIWNAGDKNGHSEYIYNGLDRTNNKLGYILENVVPCCKYCNFMKSNLTEQEFLAHIERIYNFSKDKILCEKN